MRAYMLNGHYFECEGTALDPSAVEVAVATDYAAQNNAAIAARAAAANRAANRSATKSDPVIVSLLGFTPAQLDAYVNANVADVGARPLFKALLRMVIFEAVD